MREVKKQHTGQGVKGARVLMGESYPKRVNVGF